MKGKWNLIASIVELVIGVLGIVAFIVLGLNGEAMEPWLMTLVLAGAIALFGASGISEYIGHR